MEVVYRDPKELRNNPLNIAIYGDKPDPEFIAKVKAYGIHTPLKILPNGMLLGGHRRRQAAIIAGIEEVPVVILDGLSEAEQMLTLALDNESRQETTEQRVKRAKLIEQAEAAIAAQRKDQTLAKPGEQVGRKDGANLPHPTKPEKNADCQNGQSRNPRAADKAAKAVGMGRRTYEKAKVIAAKIDEIAKTDRVAADRIRDALNKSPAAAAREIKRLEQAATPAVEGCIVRDDTDREVPMKFRDAYALAVQLGDLVKSISKLKAEISRIETAAGAVWLDSGQLKRTLGIMADIVKDAMYWTHCWRCESDGCDWCRSHGWLPKAYSRQVCDEDKAKIGGGK